MGKILRKLASIFIGWYFLATNRNNAIAKERLKICAACENRKGVVCGICFCPLVSKARLTGEFDNGCADSPKRWGAIKNPANVPTSRV